MKDDKVLYKCLKDVRDMYTKDNVYQVKQYSPRGVMLEGDEGRTHFVGLGALESGFEFVEVDGKL